MAKRFLTPINVLNSASDPGSANEGDIYYNTASDKLKIYSNASWIDVGGGGGGSSIESGETFPESPQEGLLFFNLTNFALYLYILNSWLEIGSIYSLYGGSPDTTVFVGEIDGGEPGSTYEQTVNGGPINQDLLLA